MRKFKTVDGLKVIYGFDKIELVTFVSLILALGAFLMALNDVYFWSEMLENSAYAGMKIGSGGQMYQCDVFTSYGQNLTFINDSIYGVIP